MSNLKVPKKYEKYFDRLEEESDLIDNCKYMLYFKKNVNWNGEKNMFCVPVKSKKEAIDFLSECWLEEEVSEWKN